MFIHKLAIDKLTLNLFLVLIVNITIMGPLFAVNCFMDDRQARELLVHEGYNLSTFNGSLDGYQARSVLKQYQRSQGLMETGVLDTATCEYLLASSHRNLSRSTTEQWKTVETELMPESSIKVENSAHAGVAPKPKVRIYGVEGGFHHSLQEGEGGPEMILIPPGCLMIDDEHPQKQEEVTSSSPIQTSLQTISDKEEKIPLGNNHPVNLACVGEFALSRNEVTFGEYDRFAQATKRRLPDDTGFGRGQNPVIDVDWQDAADYATWLSEQTGEGYRLPTETEWEYAVRAGTNHAWPWGNELGTNQAVCRSCGSPWDFIGVAPVGSRPANPWGLNDLGGNVWEWTCSPFVAKPLFMGLVHDVQPQRYEEGNQCARPLTVTVAG